MSMVLCHTVANASKVAAWLEAVVRPHLKADVSRYAPGRLRCWLGVEPPLSSTQPTRMGLEVEQRIMERFAEVIEWRFDFALVTYSGDARGIGIGPHRDAAFADYEARGASFSGECLFRHWEDHLALGRRQGPKSHTSQDPPTTSLVMPVGQVVAFNCKDLHAADPGPGRWGMNFWRCKPAAQ